MRINLIVACEIRIALLRCCGNHIPWTYEGGWYFIQNMQNHRVSENGYNREVSTSKAVCVPTVLRSYDYQLDYIIDISSTMTLHHAILCQHSFGRDMIIFC